MEETNERDFKKKWDKELGRVMDKWPGGIELRKLNLIFYEALDQTRKERDEAIGQVQIQLRVGDRLEKERDAKYSIEEVELAYRKRWEQVTTPERFDKVFVDADWDFFLKELLRSKEEKEG